MISGEVFRFHFQLFQVCLVYFKISHLSIQLVTGFTLTLALSRKKKGQRDGKSVHLLALLLPVSSFPSDVFPKKGDTSPTTNLSAFRFSSFFSGLPSRLSLAFNT